MKKLLGLGVDPDGLGGARACIDTSERPRSGNDTSPHKTCILFLCTRPKDTDLVAFGCSLWAESRPNLSSSQVFVSPATHRKRSTSLFTPVFLISPSVWHICPVLTHNSWYTDRTACAVPPACEVLFVELMGEGILEAVILMDQSVQIPRCVTDQMTVFPVKRLSQPVIAGLNQ